MRNPFQRAALAAALVALAAPAGAAAHDRDRHHDRTLRVATFNASLNRGADSQLIADLSTTTNAQAGAVAEVVQRVRPDVLLINEFDFDEQRTAARLFQDNYLSVGRNGAAPIHYRYRYSAPSNTGIPSGLDLNNNGTIGGADDAFGFGFFPGMFGMQVYSRHPIAEHHVRTFQLFRWADMPGARLPDDPATPAPADFYSPAELAVLRLSSKSHWDIPLVVRGEVVHVLASHPTPPVFDGPEDRNGLRNADEIRFWADYVGRRRGTASTSTTTRAAAAGCGAARASSSPATRTPTRSTATASPARSSSCSSIRASTPRSRPAARARSRRPRCRAPPTSRTAATPPSTRRTSPTARRATCARTTCCPAGAA